MEAGSLRARVDAADAERFCGREAELAVVEDLLSDTPSRLLFVYGPGGIGKSALLRAAGRSALERGYRLRAVDARTLPAEPAPAAQELLADTPDRSCVVLDEVDVLGPALEPLRDLLLDGLRDSCRLVVAGRRGPSASWHQDGLDAVLLTLPLGPLAPEWASALLTARGVAPVLVPEILAWAQGSPLALTVAAGTSRGRPVTAGSVELEQRLTAWLAGHPMLDVPPEVLEVAAFARTVDARLLAAALPGRPTRDGLRRLAALPVSERVGDAVALHAVLAAAVRARVAAVEPQRKAELVRRIAEHLAGRARLGDMTALLRLSRLIETPELRAAIGNEPSELYYPDRDRPGELAVFGRDHGFDRGPDWPEIVEWVARWPSNSLLVRRADGRPVMFSSFVPVGRLAGMTGAVADSLRAAAAGTAADPVLSYAGTVLFADGPAQDAQEAARLGSGAFMLQHGVGDLQTILIHYPPPDRRPPLPAAIANPLPGDLARPVWLSDYRPGVVALVTSMVLSEQGFAPAAPSTGDLFADDQDPDRIARLTAVLDRVFGPDPRDQRLRRAIELVHLHERTAEQDCLDALAVSRRTWFRLLRTARERVLAAG